MPPSTTSYFPDINVWVALTYEGHVDHGIAAEWFETLSADAVLTFCRFTQLGLLRLLTAKAVMDDEVMTPLQAWAAYDRWLQDPRVEFVDEAQELESRFRALTRLRQPATKNWADAYLAAFATIGGLTTVTFDQGLRTKAKSAVVLGFGRQAGSKATS